MGNSASADGSSGSSNRADASVLSKYGFDCSCLEALVGSSASLASQLLVGESESKEDKESLERLHFLQEGIKVLRPSMMGLASSELLINLSDDTSKLCYRVISSNNVIASMISSSKEFGEIDLTTQVMSVRMTGPAGIQIIGKLGATYMRPIMEVTADTTDTRDKFVLALNELMEQWRLDPSKRPSSSLSASGTSDKSKYFQQREEEIKKREKEREERKKKYAVGGLKITAQVMANRA